MFLLFFAIPADRAIKAGHILIRADGHACLSGLRSMCPIDKRSNLHSLPLQSANNLNWSSPEMLEQNLSGYNEKTDIYSIGITSCELANGFVPFAETDTTLMLTQKVKGLIPHLLDCTTCYPFEDNVADNGYQSEEAIGMNAAPVSNVYTRMFTEAFHNLVELCCQRDPQSRPTTPDLLAHAFTKQVRFKSVYNYLYMCIYICTHTHILCTKAFFSHKHIKYTVNLLIFLYIYTYTCVLYIL